MDSKQADGIAGWRAKHPDWISDHFYMGEFIYSAIAVRRGIDNMPPEKVRDTIRHLTLNLLEPLRVACGLPMSVSSGYRCPELNSLVGGANGSQHLKGEAADIRTFGSNVFLRTLEAGDLVFDQAIYYSRRGFLHLSLKAKGTNRQQIILQ